MPHDPVAVIVRQIKSGEVDHDLAEVAEALDNRRHERDAAYRQKHWYGQEEAR